MGGYFSKPSAAPELAAPDPIPAWLTMLQQKPYIQMNSSEDDPNQGGSFHSTWSSQLTLQPLDCSPDATVVQLTNIDRVHTMSAPHQFDRALHELLACHPTHRSEAGPSPPLETTGVHAAHYRYQVSRLVHDNITVVLELELVPVGMPAGHEAVGHDLPEKWVYATFRGYNPKGLPGKGYPIKSWARD